MKQFLSQADAQSFGGVIVAAVAQVSQRVAPAPFTGG
jgi:hypothetical protein